MSTATGAATLSELAARYGLRPSSARPPLATYVRKLWQRRHFIVAFATSRTVSMYSGARLGQLWQVLTPLLNAAVYYVVFGILFDTQRGIENFEAFLVTGVFVFTFTQRSVTAGARAISGNLSLIRALHFPRASLPLASTIVELQQLLVSMAVLCVIVLLTGEPLTPRWLLVVPALALQTMFNTGLALAIARVGARIPDVTQLLPFVTRTWLYLSGVLYSIPDRLAPGPLRDLMLANPAAVYIELVRDGLMATHDTPTNTWYLAVAWAVAALLGGFVFFWAAEERYGRG
ncbi:ABC transporter permease [Thermasporomyces composti]|uniref:Transport permease protein n=1 Tax=Thermasporomyces composti TaxID=696763 RepID=A0A3D9VBE6_THECX|nr:ABC transporter permease [Thermasporomyces composti]REF37500.1 teichoic acid transport system permease protein [Thermasporomyces composti]